MAVFLRLLIAIVVVLCLLSQVVAQDVEMRSVSGESQGRTYAIIGTAAAGKYLDLERLVAEGHDINEVDERGLTAAHQAAFYRRHEALGEVCKLCFSILTQLDRMLPSVNLIFSSQYALQLIRLGANLNAQDNDGWTPLMTAASTVSTMCVCNQRSCRLTVPFLCISSRATPLSCSSFWMAMHTL